MMRVSSVTFQARMYVRSLCGYKPHALSRAIRISQSMIHSVMALWEHSHRYLRNIACILCSLIWVQPALENNQTDGLLWSELNCFETITHRLVYARGRSGFKTRHVLSALRYKDSQIGILNANWSLDWSGEYKAAGSKIIYSKPRHGGSGETITIDGPLTHTVQLLVNISPVRKRIRWSSFSWFASLLIGSDVCNRVGYLLCVGASFI